MGAVRFGRVNGSLHVCLCVGGGYLVSIKSCMHACAESCVRMSADDQILCNVFFFFPSGVAFMQYVH